jgi:ATP-binding cassette, subfamily F, member 3
VDTRNYAERTSGSRGMKVRSRLNVLSAQLASFKLNQDIDPVVAIQSELAALYGQIEEEPVRRIRAGQILLDLEFKSDDMKKPLQMYRMRIAIVQSAFVDPHVILFDEPTNHLDLPAITWLRQYISKLVGKTVVIVSHDRFS